MPKPETQAEAAFNLGDLIRIFRRRLGWFVIPAAFGLFVALATALGLPPTYEASTTILIEPQGIPEKLVAPTVVQKKEARFHSIRLQILSRDNLSSVIEEFSLYADASRPMEAKVEQMRDDITIEPILPEIVDPRRPVEIDSLRIAYRGRNPAVVAEVANRLAREFIRENIEDRTAYAEGTSEFIQAELQRKEQDLSRVAQEITDYKQEHQGELPEQLPLNRQRLERLSQELAHKRAQLEGARSQVVLLRRQLQDMRTGSATADDDPVKRKAVLEMTLNAYRSHGLTDKHPDVIAARAEIEQLDTLIAARAEQAEPRMVSREENDLLRELRNYEVEMNVLAGDTERIAGEIARYEARIENTPQRAAELGHLETTYQTLTEAIRTLRLKQAEADIARSMELKQKGEKFRVIESAQAPEAPVRPNRPLIFVIGAVLGLLAGLALLVIREVTDTRLHSVAELHQVLDLPILATVPAIRLPAELAETRARRLRWGVSSALVAVLLIGAMLALYWVRSEGPERRPLPPVAAERRGDV